MPTATKLVAALIFGALAWIVSEAIKPVFPPGTDFGRFSEYNALLGLVIGWRVAGRQTPATWASAVASGLTTAVGMVVLGLLLHSAKRMIDLSLQRVYDGPMEALLDVVRIMLNNVQYLIGPSVLATLALGGVLGGLTIQWVARNTR
jgi:ABC-type xylose transport system permease subunit